MLLTAKWLNVKKYT